MRRKSMARAVLAELLRKGPMPTHRVRRSQVLRKIARATKLVRKWRVPRWRDQRSHTYALAHQMVRRKGVLRKIASPHHMVRLRKHACAHRLMRRPEHPRRPAWDLRSQTHACAHRLLRRRDDLRRTELVRRSKHGGTVAMQSTVQLRTTPNPQDGLRQVGHAVTPDCRHRPIAGQLLSFWFECV